MEERLREKTYIAIDLKSFYASVECVERGLDPLTTNLVVADPERTEKTICLAVSPSLKAHGIGGRARLFEVVAAVKKVNQDRKKRLGGQEFSGSSFDAPTLEQDPSKELDYIVAPPRMKRYEEVSAQIYTIYLRYVAPEDIHVYSIDEVFMDVTAYLNTYQMTGRELAMKMVHEVLTETGITATAGIATNLYLCKVAMDIVAKHIPADENGVRVAELNEMSYRRILWNHRPLTDFWRVGPGLARRLEKVGLYTMGDIARVSLADEDYLFRLFGVNAEYLIDHAFGYEPCTISEIKAYRPENTSVGTGQVLHCAYTHEDTKIILREMTELLALDLIEKGLQTDQIVLSIGFDRENLSDPKIQNQYKGPVELDYYGRPMPKGAHGSSNLGRYTASSLIMTDHVLRLYDRITDPCLLVRRITIAANHTLPEEKAKNRIPQGEEYPEDFAQMDLFSMGLEGSDRESEGDLSAENSSDIDETLLEKEHKMQEAMINLKKRFGKNAILKGTDLQEGANTIQRNNQIGGHRA